MIRLANSRIVARIGAASLVLAAVGGCAQVQLATHAGKRMTRSPVDVGAPAPPPTPGPSQRQRGIYKVGDPYQVAGVWYYPKADQSYDQTGIASWYGEDFHGRPTANGELYDMNLLSAAHQTLPLPSLARVTNLENGRSLVVRVNDRGPFVNGRIIDMSRRGAQLLGFERTGTARVRVTVIGPASLDGDTLEVAAAAATAEKPPIVSAPRVAVLTEALPPPPGVMGDTATVVPPVPPSSSVTLAAAGEDSLETQELRLEPVKPTALFVQAGSFTRFDNANRLQARLSPYGPTQVKQVMLGGVDFFRVRVGPMQSVTDADQILTSVIALGQGDARIVVD
jgi:rare lipoprotein A